MDKRKDYRDVFRSNLRYFRLKNKYTQEDLADKSGLTDKYISDLERGQFSPSFDKIIELSYALSIEPYKLLKEENRNDDIPNRLDKITKTRKSKKKY